ncbi:MAG TPA: VOC family protein [Rhizomicrobium sp.]|nr:VOC family protein [Rhizomicrobium sp.]
MLSHLLTLAILAAVTPAAAPAKPPPMDYVEFKVADMARTKAFYSAIFGWEFTDYGPGYTSFVDNGLGGGFTTAGTPTPGGPLMVFHVDDLEAAFARARAAGAVIVKPIYSFPGGRRFEMKDPDGYDIAAWTQE